MSANPRIQTINEELERLAQKRNLVEKRIEFRLQTLDKFNELHEESLSRVYEHTIKQNEAARVRNHNLLCQIGAVNGALRSRAAVQGRSSAAVQLEHAKKSYLSFSSKLYPTWKEQSTFKKMNTLKTLQQEKEEAEKRRLKSLYNLRQEHEIRTAVEEERRQLLLALSLEQRDQLEASAKYHILKDKGRAVESELQSQFQQFGDEYERYIAEAATRGVEEAHSILRPLFSVPKEPPAISGIINSQRTGLQGRLSEQQQRYQQLPPPHYQTHQFPGQHSSYVNEDPVDCLPSSHSTPRRHPQYEHRSHSIDSSLHEGISFPSSTSRAGSHHPLIQSSLSQSSIREQELPSPPPQNKISLEGHSLQRPQIISPPLPSPVIIEQEKLSAALPVKPPVRKQFSELPSVQPEPPERQPSPLPVPELVLLENQSNISPRQSRVIETQHQSQAELPSQPTDLPSAHSSPKAELFQDQLQSLPKSESVDLSLSARESAVTAATAIILSPQTPPPSHNISEEEKSQGNIQDLCLSESLSVADITRLLTIICAYIENLEEPLIVKKSYYSASNPSSSSNLTRKTVNLAMDAASLDELGNESNSDENPPLPPEVLCWIVLKFAEEKGSYLLPSEILNGVVSIEKLNKIHKKLGGGRHEVWTSFMNHLRKLIELKRVTQEEISKLFTTAFIIHLDDSEKSRNERKVMKLVQLSILPHEKEQYSRPPTPQKRYVPPSDLSATPPGTPGYSERPSSAGSINSAPPSPALPPPSKLLSLRGIEKLEQQSQFTMTLNSRQSSDSTMGIAAKRPSYEANPDSLSSKILKAANVFKVDDDEIEDDEDSQPFKSNPVVLKDISSTGDDEFDF